MIFQAVPDHIALLPWILRKELNLLNPDTKGKPTTQNLCKQADRIVPTILDKFFFVFLN